MIKAKSIISRLKNPSVIISIASQIITILMLLKVNVDESLIMGAITSITSVLVMLGIMSNPTTRNKGYGDDMIMCKTCGKHTPHVLTGTNMSCSICGTINE